MMSSRRAAPHQGSGCVTPPTHEAEYMAATVFPSASAHSALAFGLGPYMTDKIGQPVKLTHYRMTVRAERADKSAITFTTNF